MVSKKQIATGLTAIAVGLGSNLAYSAENRTEISKGPSSVPLNLSAKPTSRPQVKVEEDVVVSKETPKSQEPIKLKRTSDLNKSRVDICSPVIDEYKFGNPPKSKFGSAIHIKDQIPGCSANGAYSKALSTALRSNYGGNWKTLDYSIGPIGSPIFTSNGKSLVSKLSKYNNGKHDEVLVYNLDFAGNNLKTKVFPVVNNSSDLSSSKIRQIRDTNSTLPAISIENKTIPTVTAAQGSYTSIPTILGNGVYAFDIDGDLYPNVLTLFEQNGKTYVKNEQNGKLESILDVDAARYKVLQNARFVENSTVNADAGYLMSFGMQGEQVVRFMVDTNKYATEISKDQQGYNFSAQTKFANLEGLVDFIDNVANFNIRADYISNEILKHNTDKSVVVNGKNAQLKAYANTFGEEVPAGMVALYFTVGSAVYTVLNSDYLPTVKAAQGLVIARGAQNGENLELITSGYNRGNLLGASVRAYADTVKMYGAQIEASKKQVGRENF